MSATNWKGLDHYPVGNAVLTTVGANLQISGIGSSGLDGVQIDLAGLYNNLQITHDSIELGPDESMNAILYLKDDTGTSFPFLYYSLVYNGDTGNTEMQVNTSMLSPHFYITGYNEGTSVYNSGDDVEPGTIIKIWNWTSASGNTDVHINILLFEDDIWLGGQCLISFSASEAKTPSGGSSVSADLVGYQTEQMLELSNYSNLRPDYVLILAKSTGNITFTNETYDTW